MKSSPRREPSGKQNAQQPRLHLEILESLSVSRLLRVSKLSGKIVKSRELTLENSREISRTSGILVGQKIDNDENFREFLRRKTSKNTIIHAIIIEKKVQKSAAGEKNWAGVLICREFSIMSKIFESSRHSRKFSRVLESLENLELSGQTLERLSRCSLATTIQIAI